MSAPLLEARGIWKRYGAVQALRSVNLTVHGGEVHCLLGDNGAGKSSLIKVLSGVIPSDEGEILVDGEEADFRGPQDALDEGIATVFQDLAVVPILPVFRNFFLGREPTKGWGPFRRFDVREAEQHTRAALHEVGIDLEDVRRPAMTLSGGQRQCVAIAKAMHFGAKVLILDEPTSALGVRQSGIVLEYVLQARAKGLGIVLITHNVQHALPVGDSFTILKRGEASGPFGREDLGADDLTHLMGGGEELDVLAARLAGARSDSQQVRGSS